MSSRLAAIATALALVATACGDPDTAPASEGAATTSASTEAATATTAGPTTSVESVEATTPANPVPTSVASPFTTAPAPGDDLDRVFASDPFPAQADAATDPAIATEAITYAYRHWILLDLDPAIRARIIEDGEEATERIESTLDAVEGTIRDAGFEVDEVNLTGVDSAEVVFRITWQGGPSPIFPEAMTGTALYRDGSWRVAGRTLCLLAVGIGQECGGDAPRLAPFAFRVNGLPTDAEQAPEYSDTGEETDPIPGVVRVPGIASWWPEGEPPYLESGPVFGISTYVLPDVASRSDADIAVVIRARWGSDGPVEQVAGGRGRTESSDGFARVLVVRSDDVIVDVNSAELSVDELIAIVESLEPVDLPA